MIRVTARQRDVLREIRRFQRKHGFTPSMREIGDELGMRSPSTVYQHIVALKRKGCLRGILNTERALVITEVGHQVLNGTSEEART